MAPAGERGVDLPVKFPDLDIPALLRQHGFHPNKRLGQNFLIDNTSLLKVVEAAELQPQDCVLEVGAGLGNLTRHLAARTRQVVAVELDDRIIPILRKVLEPYQNVCIVHGDILSLDPADLFQPSLQGSYQVVANIPYYITSALIRHLLEATPPPQRLCLTLQEEVAERICAQPGNLSLLALSVQLYGSPQIAVRIPAEAFYPPPKVDSAVVRVDLYAQPLIPFSQIDDFFRLAKAGFGQKRKTLRNALANNMNLPVMKIEKLLISAGIDPQRRAETLSLAEWIKLLEKHLSGAQ
jgi:16S rRNA (adenine1518-N6/adenine1519-N6)-dimethyltransferase